MCNLKNWHEFLAVLTLAIAILFALPANIFAEGENPSSWRLVKTPAKDVTVTLKTSIALNPAYIQGTYYMVFSDYSAASEGCDRMSLELSIPEAQLKAKPVKSTSGMTYWVASFRPSDFLMYDNWNNITAVLKYTVRTYNIRLVPGKDDPMQINANDRKRFTSVTKRYDYNDVKFQNYITSCNLKRFENETELDFYYRVYRTVVDNIKYQKGASTAIKSSTTIGLKTMNCEAAGIFIASVMRSNGIPAKVEVGFNCSKDITLSPISAAHGLISAYINGIGWVTTDPTKEMIDKSDGFTIFTGNTVPWYNAGDSEEGNDRIEVDGDSLIVIPSPLIRIYDKNIKNQYGQPPTGQPYSIKEFWEVKTKTL